MIAFSNEDMVTAFDFFDGKNQKRTSDVRELIMDQKKNLDNVDKIMRNVKTQVSNNYEKMEDLLRMHGEYKKKLEECEGKIKKNADNSASDNEGGRKKASKKGKKKR